MNRPDPFEDRSDWDRAWRAMPHRHLASPPRIEIDPGLIAHFGDLISATLALDPPQYCERCWRESEACPVCGATTAGVVRLPATLHPGFEGGLSLGFGVWVHPACFQGCLEDSGPAPVPW